MSSSSASSSSSTPCVQAGRLPSSWVQILTNFVNTQNANPTGIWADYNCVYRSWLNLHRFVNKKLLCESDLPDEPNIADYTDVESSATLECPHHCCGSCGRCDICGEPLGNTKLTFGPFTTSSSSSS